MCGIAGIVGADADPGVVKKMTDALAHRGPDGEGHWNAPGVALGHRRLSIIDLSTAGAQPMISADGRFVVTFNGEIYNYKELRAAMPEYPYQSETDTEVILAGWQKEGERFLERMIGMFAFVIYDRERNEIIAARDHVGIKPFFYALRNGVFYFASEIKAFAAAGLRFEPDFLTIAEYLETGLYDHGEGTFFKGVRRLSPGHALTFSDGTLRIRRFWDLAERVKSRRPPVNAEVVDEFRALLDDAFRLQLRSDVPVGINLSGGIDSASLLYRVNVLSGERGLLHAFTMGFEEREADERPFVSRLVGGTGNPWHTSVLKPGEFFEYARAALRHQDEPYGGIATVAYHKMNETAHAADITVLLEGQGVDEMLAGYAYFDGFLYADYLKSGNFVALAREARRLGARSVAHAIRTRNEIRYQDRSKFLNHPLLRGEFIEQFGGAHTEIPRPFSSELSNALYRDVMYTKLPRVMRFNDHASMAFGRELRVPYLDHRVIEFAFTLGSNWKIRAGTRKMLLREAMKGIVPEEFRALQKRPVVTPQTAWLRGPLGDEIESLFASRSFAARPYADAARVREAFRAFRSRTTSENSFAFWQHINLELWFRMFID